MVANVHDSNVTADLLQGTEEVYGYNGYLGADKKENVQTVDDDGDEIRYNNFCPSQMRHLYT